MDGHGKNHLSDGWARDKSLIRWMGTGQIIFRWMGTGVNIYQMDGHGINHLSDYQMDGHGINHLSDGWARDKSFIRWMGTG